MAKVITIVKKNENCDVQVRLHNNDLILVKKDGRLLPFLVTSYIPLDESTPEGQQMGNYCSLVNLETGGKAFAQALPRKTDYKEIGRFLSNTNGFTWVNDARLSIIKNDNYELSISILE